MTGSLLPRRTAIIVALALTVTACGQMPAPEPQPTATQPPAPVVTGSPVATAARELTLGDLASRSNAAWSDVHSFRITFTGRTGAAALSPATPAPGVAATPQATPVASPLATPAAMFVSVRAVILPAQQSQSVTGLGESDHEAIVSGDRLYLRGPLVRQVVPSAPDDAWIVIDPATVPQGSALFGLLGGLPTPPRAPLSSLPERLAPQVVRDLGSTSFDGRECRIYGAADTMSTTGSRIDFAIALDQNDLPCFIETSAAGATIGRDEYSAINEPFTIATPSAATPATVPPALASPVHGD
jgi:hypothetical protein